MSAYNVFLQLHPGRVLGCGVDDRVNELHAVEAVGDGGIVERAVVGRTARLHRQNGADDVLVDVGKGDDQSLGVAGGDTAVRAGLLGDITGTAGQGLRGLALGGVLQIIRIVLPSLP